MPSAAARRIYEDQIPSFMSVFDPEADNIDDRELVTVVDSKFMDMEGPKMAATQAPQQQHQQLPQSHIDQHLRPLPTDALHRHHDSTSTQNSESADSSPTTTLITDTSSLSDPSPSSSPDSPVNLIPLNNFPATNFGGLPSTMNSLSVNDTNLRPVTSPSPRRRNMKGLSIQPPFGGNLSSSLVSEPSSPSFIKPKIPGMKRKPSQLSLKTDTAGLNIQPITLKVPTSPGLPPILQRRSLKHSTSSPHMLSGMKSATFGPAGGMCLPSLGERGSSGLSEMLRPTKQASIGPSFEATIHEEESSPIRSQVASRAAMDMEPFRDESEKNEDQKSPGYPNGPIAIYDDNVYLYLEPTADEASKFDVVINVASEVHNPFELALKRKQEEERMFGKKPAPTSESPIPDTAMTNDSFATAFEFPQANDRYAETPTTPKANPFQEPEYIHMPWDHNTDITTDLMALCEKIEERTKEGKKVLVHCQQGASRSASLIIAYGLYQNPGQSVNDAYYAAQSKSKWISPNMKLMYCLQDFQKEVAKRKPPPRSAAGPRSGRRTPTKHRLTLSASDVIDIKPKQPLTAPLPGEEHESLKPPSPERSPKHPREKSTSNRAAISPGPSSAPSSFSWSEKEDENDPGKFGRFNLIQEATDPPSKYLKPEPHVRPKRSLKLKRSIELRPVPRKQPSMELKPESIFSPTSSFFAPPPSPGFGSHRFGGGLQSLGFSSLTPTPAAVTCDGRTDMPADGGVSLAPALPEEDALMSPRAETMTNNPLHDSFSGMAGMTFVEQPPTPSEGLFSPRVTLFPRDPLQPFGRPSQDDDPRSPPTKGETPITRSIDDVL